MLSNNEFCEATEPNNGNVCSTGKSIDPVDVIDEDLETLAIPDGGTIGDGGRIGDDG